MAIRAEHAAALPQDPISEIPEGLRSAYAKHLLNKHLRTLRAKLSHGVSESDPLPPGSLSHAPTSHDTDEALPEYNGRVAIVGAGATGLYLAMMMKFLEIKNVDIYEASDRIGGRCYTYNFPEDKDCPHNYYDIGAMRIPKIPAMDSTLNLIEELGIPKSKYVLNAKCEPQMHYYSNDPDVAPKGKKYEARIKQIIEGLTKNWDHEFAELMKGHDDNYSTRAWLMHTKPRLTYEETEEAESAETSTGLFDQSFIESLCDYSDFQAATGKPWYRLDGGMSTLTGKMNECIEDPKWLPDNPISLKVKTNTPVVAMSENRSSNKIEVTLAGAEQPESYDMVFNTTAMGPLQRMDIAGLVPGFGLPETQKKILTGIRALSYDRASKVAIKFKTRWWKNMYNGPKAVAKIGGVSGTDLAISNVVYPSWDDKDKSAVLMVSYSWAQDATRMGALIPDYSKQDPCIDDTVVKQSFQDLARLWAESDPAITVDFLKDQYVTHHAYAWSHDPYTGGAFALFGPGQFKYMYPEFQHVFCGGKFAMCGEALSPHHAWISGALDSAYITLARWLGHHKDHRRIEALRKSWFGKGKNEDPAEYDDNLLYWSVELSKEVTKKITPSGQ